MLRIIRPGRSGAPQGDATAPVPSTAVAPPHAACRLSTVPGGGGGARGVTAASRDGVSTVLPGIAMDLAARVAPALQRRGARLSCTVPTADVVMVGSLHGSQKLTPSPSSGDSPATMTPQWPPWEQEDLRSLWVTVGMPTPDYVRRLSKHWLGPQSPAVEVTFVDHVVWPTALVLLRRLAKAWTSAEHGAGASGQPPRQLSDAFLITRGGDTETDQPPNGSGVNTSLDDDDDDEEEDAEGEAAPTVHQAALTALAPLDGTCATADSAHLSGAPKTDPVVMLAGRQPSRRRPPPDAFPSSQPHPPLSDAVAPGGVVFESDDMKAATAGASFSSVDTEPAQAPERKMMPAKTAGSIAQVSVPLARQAEPRPTLPHPSVPAAAPPPSPNAILAVALLTATKLLEDRTQPMSFYASITGIPVVMLRKAERVFLSQLRYSVQLPSPDELRSAREDLRVIHVEEGRPPPQHPH